MKKICSLIVMLSMLSSLSSASFASNGTWADTGDTGANWFYADNWATGIIPGSNAGTTNTDIATFNSSIGGDGFGSITTPVIIDSGTNIGGINFDTATDNYYIGSTSLNPILLSSGGAIQILSTLTSTNAIETINAPLVIEGASGTYTFANNSASGSGAGAGTLNFGGEISGGAAGNTTLYLSGTNTNSNTISGVIANGSATSLGVTQNGTGTWILSGANTYTGGTTINAGTLTVATGGSLGATTGALSVNNTNTGTGTAVVLNLSTSAPTTTGSLSGTISTPSSGTNSATINNGGELFTVNQTSAATYAGVIAGTGGLALGSLSSATLTLTGDNTYTGGTILDAGTLNLGSSNAIGTSGTIAFNGGTLQYSASNTTDYSSRFSTAADQAYNIDTNGQDVTFASALTSSAGSLTKFGSGMLTLSGANTYSGATTVNNGTLQAGVSTQAFGVGSAVTVASGASLDLGGYNETIGSLAGAGTVTNSGSSSPAVVTTGVNNSSTTFSGDIQDGTSTVGLLKEGSGILTLSGDNTYSGGTTLEAGTLNLGSSNAIGTSGTITFNGGTLQYSASNTTDYSSRFSTAANQAYNIDTNGQDVTFAGNLTSSGGVLTKIGSGILTLSATNTYSGGTSLDAGILDLASSGAIGSSGTITFDGGTLQYSASNTTDYSSRFSTAIDQAYDIDTNGQDVTFASALTSSGGSLTKIGNGTLTLTNANTYSGATTINGGTLQVRNAAAIPDASNVSIASGATLDLNGNSQTIGSLAGAGAVTSNSAGSVILTAGDASSTTFSGTIDNGSGTLGLTTAGTGSLTLNGANDFSGGTDIVNGSTLQVGNANALGTGTVENNGTLNLGITNLSLSNTYTQNTNSALDLTIDSPSSVGKITTAVAASVAAGSSINVNVGYDAPNNTTYEIINTQGAGITGSAPTTVTSNSAVVTFTSSIVGPDLYITAENSGFGPFADNANAGAVANVLDTVTNPSSDLQTVKNTLITLSSSQLSSALNSMVPEVDGGGIQNSAAALNNVVSVTLDRIQSSLDNATATNTGISSGDTGTENDLWAKPYGSYLNQGTLDGIQGYNAWNAGSVVGYDHMITDTLTIGVSGGYAYGDVNSDANNAITNINSAQGTLYAGYEDPNLDYYIDAAGSFAWNWYDGKRDINLGDIARTADADYNGQQYGTYVEGGYNINYSDNLKITPLASLQWTHLSLDSYTETNAGALDLSVASQAYDVLESGLGASISLPEQFNWGSFTPEFHAKWLYDFINDPMSITSSFTGGGASFTSNGATPSKEGADIGGKLSLDLTDDISFIAQVDAELKNEYIGVYGSGTIRYKF